MSLISCTEDKKGEPASEPAEAPVTLDSTGAIEAAEQGFQVVSFDFDSDSEVMQIVASAEGQQLRLVTLVSPDEVVIYDSKRSGDLALSPAGTFQASPNVFNYPQKTSQAPLIRGRYVASYEVKGTSSSATEPPPISLEIVTKDDSDLSSGIVNVTVLYSGVVFNDKALIDDVRAAFNTTQLILSRANISLYVQEVDAPALPEILPDPKKGDVLYEELSKVNEDGIVMVFSTNASGIASDQYTSASAGSLPGPAVPSPRSAIVVSLTRATGSDGALDADYDDDSDYVDQVDDSEVRLLGESMAHEILHYLGLPNSLTFQGSTVVASDGLNSEKCLSINACEENRGANGNIMFPFALQNRDSNNSGYSFYPRDRFASQQIELIQRSVLVD